MIRAAVAEAGGVDMVVEISVPGGERLAEKTMNPRLGIVGGISILGTTGIVIPFSCSAWIHSIYSGIDVARACHIGHIAGATGTTSEAAVQKLHGLPEAALIDMGDFVGGMLKYLRTHPVARVTIAGGVAKMTKLGQGFLDLHSRRGEADRDRLAEVAREAGGTTALAGRIRAANTVAEAFAHAEAEGLRLGDAVAAGAWQVAARMLAGTPSEVEIVLFDRAGRLMGRAGFAHVPSRPLKRR
jgi:cobalt-precorrin-5B (C1)-methyltransferase